MVWTDEAVEELKRMWDKGMTTGQIAKVLNVTKNSIIGKVHRLCLTARPPPIKKSENSEDKKKTSKPAKVEKNKTKETPSKPAKCVKKSPIEEPQKPVAPIIEETNIPLVKLDNHTCRWPIGDPKDEDFCFCGKRIKTGQTYCEEHAAVAYVKAGKKI